MKLSDLLRISNDTIQNYKPLVLMLDMYEHFYNPDMLPEVISEIQKTPPFLLIHLAILNPAIDRLCKSPALLQHWETVWRSFASRNTQLMSAQADKVQQGYQPEPTMHCLDLIKGAYLYRQYKVELVENPDHANDYLTRSAKFGCFSAINTFCRQTLKKLQSDFTQSDVDDLLLVSQVAAEFHWTPGYLLLANVNVELASIVDKKYRERFTALSYNTKFFRGALEALYFAEYFEDFSQPSIHNAYGGKSLADVYKGTDLIDMHFARQRLIDKHPELREENDLVKERTKLAFDKLALNYHLNSPETGTIKVSF